MAGLLTLIAKVFNKKKQALTDDILKDTDNLIEEEDRNENDKDEKLVQTNSSDDDSEEEEYEVVEREILPNKMICPDCGGITLEGLEFCDKCGGELLN